MTQLRHVPDFASVADDYDGFIIDLWGVIHDGVTPYPGAVEVLRRLRDARKPAILLSNAPRRSSAAVAAMRAMGIGDDLYAGLMTSGEAVHEALRRPPDAWWASLGPRLYHLGPERDRNVFADLDRRQVANPDDADFVLNTGPDDEADPTTIAPFEGVLQACLDRALPMVCANPDLEVIRGGMRVICAGALAARYAALGGDVRLLGKPDPAIYGPVLEALGVKRSRVLAVGDSLRTDIAGAAAAGVDACWVLGGIHAEEFDGDRARADQAAASFGLTPVAVIPSFVWAA
jgi:HAD superfamily hydrolase (TIGR01459 family)